MCFKNNTDNLLYFATEFYVQTSVKGQFSLALECIKQNDISCQPECVIDLYFCFVLDEYS